MQYVPALDGLRALAILAVLVFHARPRSLPGGFTGVDVFFVLSGYLIGSVILCDLRASKFSLREFYLRRVQRLIPNAVVMILVTVLISQLLLLPSATTKTAEHGIWSLFNLSNVFIWRNLGGYWGDTAVSAPLLHTWSLAVEEQFYIGLPVMLWLLSRYRPTAVFPVLSLLSLGSFALSVWGTSRFPSATFYLLPTRAWEPLLGAALAAYCTPVSGDRPLITLAPSRFLELCGTLGFAAIAAGFFLIGEDEGFPGVQALLPTVGALALIAAIAHGGTTAARLLALPAFVGIGKVSYSLYLWHWPGIVIGKQYAELIDLPDRVGRYVGLGVGLVLAMAAYWFVEQPLRRRGPTRRLNLGLTAVGFAISLMACLTAEQRHTADVAKLFDQPTYAGMQYDVSYPDLIIRPAETVQFSGVLFSEPADRRSGAWRSGGIVYSGASETPRVVVLGDSHATMYGSVIHSVCQEMNLSVAFLCASSSTVFFPTAPCAIFSTTEQAAEFDEARRAWLSKWRPDAVLVINRWDAVNADVLPTRLASLVNELQQYCRKIVFFGQVPALALGQSTNLREYAAYQQHLTGGLPRIDPSRHEAVRARATQAIEAIAASQPHVSLVRAEAAFLQDDGAVRYASNRSFFYADDDHLTQAGAELLRNEIKLAIIEAIGKD